MERDILGQGFKWSEFLDKANTFTNTIEEMEEAKTQARLLEPEQYGEMSNLVAHFRICILAGFYLHAVESYKKIRMYYIKD